MPTLMNSRGEMVDFSTGEVVGRAEGALTERPPRAPGGPEISSNAFDKLNQLTWGVQTAMFSLPDAAQRAIGKQLGMGEDEVFQFSRLFNKSLPEKLGGRTERAPQNIEERFARALGEGGGAGLPFTGYIAAVAAARPLISAAAPAKGILKGIADDAIKFAQKNPTTAVALDVAFGAGYEGLRQAVKESVDDSDPNKKLYEDLLPAAAFMGVPAALSVMPSVRAAKWAAGKVGSPAALGDVQQEVYSTLPKPYKWPLINLFTKNVMNRAEKKLTEAFGSLDAPETQQALTALRNTLSDPRIAQAGFKFNLVEETMDPAMLAKQRENLSRLDPKASEAHLARENQNILAFQNLFKNMSPEARVPVEEAFRAAQTDRQKFFDDLLLSKKDLTDGELAELSQRLGPQNIDQLNNELRGVLMADMEADFGMRQKILSRLGMKRATNPDGTLADTRFRDGPNAGKSLPQYPAFNIEDAARSLVNKYYPARATKTLGGPVPEPIRILANMVKTTDQKRKEALDIAFDSVIRQRVDEQLGGRDIPEDIYAKLIENVRLLVEPSSAKSAKLMQEAQRQINLLKLDVGKNEIPVATGIYGKPVYINPEQIKLDSQLIAQNSSNLDLNLPEALDLLAAAQRARHDAVNSFNSTQMEARGLRISDAQLLLDRGNAGFKDVEDLVLKSIPKARQEYDAMKMVLDDYNAGFEQRLPLLLTSKRAGGRDFLLPNEDLMKTAFKTAENLRQLQTTLGNNPQTASIIERGAIDWLRGQKVLTPEGLVDPRKIRQVLDKNKNIVEALPANVQMKLQDEVKFADDFVRRSGELDKRRVAATDSELDRLLAKATRPGADPAQTLALAMRDPATMQTLVRGVEKDPEMLAALRRSVFDIAQGASEKGGSLKSFIDANEKAMKVLFKDANHLEDLKKLAEIQRRVYAFADVTGSMPRFESTDDQFKRYLGFGIQFGTTTTREALNDRINPATGGLMLGLRMAGSLEKDVYARMMTRALESEKAAKAFSTIGSKAEAERAAGELQKIGIPMSQYMGDVARGGIMQEATQATLEGRQSPVGNMKNLPVVPGTNAQQMLKAMPPAPPTRGTNFNLRTAPAAPPGAGAGASNVQLMYPSMFPNDPISGLLQQRQAQIQAPRQ
jgi:hypothetical protein